MQYSRISLSVIITMTHLWDINSGCVEDPLFTFYNESWQEFKKEKSWLSNALYGTIPVYWVWIKPGVGNWEDFSEDESNEELILVFLSLAPCNPYVLHIPVTEDDEVSVERWLKKHGFLLGG